MNILFDLGHPAHVHLFRNVARSLITLGHRVHITIRNRKDIRDLLDLYGFSYYPASTSRTSFVGLAWELIEHDWQLLRLARRLKIDVMAGTSVAVAHASRLLPSIKSAVFEEDDASVVPLFAKLTYPFADKVVVPGCISDQRRANYVLHDSYHELAYLHPNHFTPDESVLAKLSITPGEPYFIVRLVALKAHHDLGQQGINRDLQHRLLESLEARGRVFVTMEGELPEEFYHYQMTIPPHLMHHAMAFASMMVTDSQTMTAESAVLGVPAVRCNTFVGRLAYLDELENSYGLAFGYRPNQAEAMLSKVSELAGRQDLTAEWQEKRRRMLQDKIDFHRWTVDFLQELGEHE